LPWTEKWTRRKPKRSRPRKKHSEIGPKQRRERRFHTWGSTRHVTCTGCRGDSAGLFRCGTLPSGRFSPPRRRRLRFLRPPQVGRCNCSCFVLAFAPAIPASRRRHPRRTILLGERFYRRGLTLPLGATTDRCERKTNALAKDRPSLRFCGQVRCAAPPTRPKKAGRLGDPAAARRRCPPWPRSRKRARSPRLRTRGPSLRSAQP